MTRGGRKGVGRWAGYACGLGVVLLGGLCSPVSAGVVLRFETRDLGEEEAVPQRGITRIQGKWLRLDLYSRDGDAPASSVHFDGERRVMARVDHQARIVTELSLEQLKKMMQGVSAQLEAEREGMEGERSGALPEQRRQPQEDPERHEAGRRRSEKGLPNIETRETDRLERVDGKSCVIVEVVRAGVVLREACVVEWQRLGLDPQTLAVFAELGAFFDEMMAGLPEGAGASREGNPFVAFEKLDGLPLLVRAFENGEPRQETLLTLEESRPLDAEELQPPESYRRVDAVSP